MSIFPRKIMQGQYLIIHYRIRSGYRAIDAEVKIRSILKGPDFQSELPEISFPILLGERRNLYLVLGIDAQFRAGRYYLIANANIDGENIPSSMRETDFFDVEGLMTVLKEPYLKVFVDITPSLMVALYLGAFEKADLRLIALRKLELVRYPKSTTERKCVEDAILFDLIITGSTDVTPDAKTKTGQRILQKLNKSYSVLQAAYQLKDLPMLLRILGVHSYGI